MNNVGSHGSLPAALHVMRAIALCGGILLQSGCGRYSDEVIGKVIQSIENADSTAIAEVTLSEHGATVPDVYRVYVGNLSTRQLFPCTLLARSVPDNIEVVEVEGSREHAASATPNNWGGIAVPLAVLHPIRAWKILRRFPWDTRRGWTQRKRPASIASRSFPSIELRLAPAQW
ncbi:MAG: hypothetical protein IRZ28_17645 [Steroidobacteraceae bacterium]|nr:hypothetical protein [Steroidobacteraceae bacterium]